MLGRVAELNYLNELYESEKFEFLVMYGRRRVGKTTLLQEFSKHTNAIFFPAREKNDALNLEDYSKTIQLYFDQQFRDRPANRNTYSSVGIDWQIKSNHVLSLYSEVTHNQKIDAYRADTYVYSQNPSYDSVFTTTNDTKAYFLKTYKLPEIELLGEWRL